MMDRFSWFRRSVSKGSDNNKNSLNPNHQIPKRGGGGGGGEEELLGVTQPLIDHVKSFTIDTFKNFPLQDETTSSSSTTTSTNVQRDLSEWQERHATLVLSKVKELSQLRFKLCPGYLKERRFWMIYFMLVKSHVAEYELHAIRMAKLERMAMENEEPSNTIGFEVEMAETKQSASLAPPTP